MLQELKHFLGAEPLITLFVTIVLGYFIGKFRYKTFVLGGIAGSLIMGVVIGQFRVKVAPEIGAMFFALFIYAVGYQGGPQFFRSLNRKTLNQLVSATLTCVFGLLAVLFCAYVFHLDRGTAAGLAAGGLTQSAMIGTASSAIGKLEGVSSHAIAVMQSNVAVGYAICYIFGSFGPILMLCTVFPGMMKWNLRDAARNLAKKVSGQAILSPGEFEAMPGIVTRCYQVAEASPVIGKTASCLFEKADDFAVDAVLRSGKTQNVTPDFVLQAGDLIAVTSARERLIEVASKLGAEVATPKGLQLTEETAHVVLNKKQFDGKTVKQLYQATDKAEHFGVLVDSVTRLGESIPASPGLVLKRGDEVALTGRPSRIDSFASKLGAVVNAAKLTDFISFGIGLTLGFLLGMIRVHIGDVAISLGSGGGCLFSGLLMGWLRSRKPQWGALPEGASNFLRDFGLAIFVATVGLKAGPQAVDSIRSHGSELFLLGIFVTIVPQILAFFTSYYVLKIKDPIVLLSTIAGGRSANPGFAALLDKAGNSTPVVPFTATYAIANIWLTLWGPVIVALVTLNVH
jgi:aspartate-alanine antiporter